MTKRSRSVPAWINAGARVIVGCVTAMACVSTSVASAQSGAQDVLGLTSFSSGSVSQSLSGYNSGAARQLAGSSYFADQLTNIAVQSSGPPPTDRPVKPVEFMPQAPTLSAHSPGQSSRYTTAGPWFVDDEGRAFLTAGINLTSKRAPYTPEAAGFDDDDAKFLAAAGIDSMRLGFIWKGVEPEPGVYDQEYIASIKRTATLLTDHGIAVLLDAHQDQYHEKFGGEFAPDWAVIDDAIPSFPNVGFPTNYMVNAGLLRSLDNFMKNRPGPGGIGLHERFAAMWEHIAAHFNDMPGIMGYNLINEPWPGSYYPACLFGDCEEPNRMLRQLHDKTAQAVWRSDPDAVVLVEAYATANSGAPGEMAPPQPPAALGPTGTLDGRLAYGVHVYCYVDAQLHTKAGCDKLDNHIFDTGVKHAQQDNAAVLLTEFGATHNLGLLDDVVEKARVRTMGWQYWAYCYCNDPTSQDALAQRLVDSLDGPITIDRVNTTKLAIVAPAHSRLIAGIPQGDTWNSVAREFSTSWITTGRDERVSTIATPATLYPHGYTVSVTGGRVVSAPHAAELAVVADSASNGEHTVKVSVSPAS